MLHKQTPRENVKYPNFQTQFRLSLSLERSSKISRNLSYPINLLIVDVFFLKSNVRIQQACKLRFLNNSRYMRTCTRRLHESCLMKLQTKKQQDLAVALKRKTLKWVKQPKANEQMNNNFYRQYQMTCNTSSKMSGFPGGFIHPIMTPSWFINLI